MRVNYRNLLFYYFIEGSVLQEVKLSNLDSARFSNEGVSPKLRLKRVNSR